MRRPFRALWPNWADPNEPGNCAKCPYPNCGYVYRIDIEQVVEYGQTVAVRGPEGRMNPTARQEDVYRSEVPQL